SQGSEFGEVLFMLPDDDSSRILCRELIYTAVTRAKKKVVVYGREEVLEKAMARRVVRHGGLIKMLGEQDGK
ncbi:MAG: exodeoxyribonuclease V subunit alpha, partial [Acidobacteria bacterium]